MTPNSSVPALLWKPSTRLLSQARLKQYIDWLFVKKGLYFRNYDDLWDWSVTDLEHFWESISQFFGVQFTKPYQYIVRFPNGGGMIGTDWFGGATLNYAEHIFRQRTPHRPALLYAAEQQELREMSWTELAHQVAALSAFLRAKGVGLGDRVVAVLPNGPEAIVSFLATNAVGAIWSLSSPDLSTSVLIDRYQPLAPKILIAGSGYSYNGRFIDKAVAIDELRAALPTLLVTLWIPYLTQNDQPSTRSVGSWRSASPLPATPSTDSLLWQDMLETEAPDGLLFESVPFLHPIWVLYSSGTTGKPKAITHSVGGSLLEHLKALALHQDVRPGERYCWYSLSGNLMWNVVLGAMLVGATPVLYDGAPAYPSLHRLWEVIDRAQVHHFGSAAAYMLTCMRSGIRPIDIYQLTALRAISTTGAPLPVDGFQWLQSAVKADVWLGSVGSDTEICSGFVGRNPLLPVYAGEIQCRLLGCNVNVMDEKNQLVENQPGELVLLKPMPSMPIYFWNDPGNVGYRSSYFSKQPHVWQHGDWVTLTARHTVVMLGRVGATLIQGNNRVGTAEIYSIVEQMTAIADSLVVGVERPGGSYYMPLFVVLRHGFVLDTLLKNSIVQALKKRFGGRWLPDAIMQVAEIPYTIGGKKLEIPIRRMLSGTDASLVINPNTMRNPAVLDLFSEVIGSIKAWW